MADRDKNGRFINGHRGFKAVGGKYKRLRKALLSEETGLIDKVIEQALGGDMVALKLCFEKLYGHGPIPSIKFRGTDPLAISESLLSAVGHCDSESLLQAARLVETHVKIQEFADFEERLEALESAKK